MLTDRPHPSKSAFGANLDELNLVGDLRGFDGKSYSFEVGAKRPTVHHKMIGECAVIATIDVAGNLLDVVRQDSGVLVGCEETGVRALGRVGSVTVGREKYAEIGFGDTMVSRRHALISMEDECVSITDRDSTNGTKLWVSIDHDDFLSRSPGRVRAAQFSMYPKGEDSFLSMGDRSVFGVFDGVGGQLCGANSANTAREVIRKYYTHNGALHETTSSRALIRLRTSLEKANEVIINRYGSHGGTTAAVCQVVHGMNGRKSVAWASIGDSRVYHFSQGVGVQISRDEGSGSTLYKCLGRSYGNGSLIEQSGVFDASQGDHVVLLTDGVTGGYRDRTELLNYISKALNKYQHPQEAALELVSKAAVKDDRTAIVVKI